MLDLIFICCLAAVLLSTLVVSLTGSFCSILSRNDDMFLRAKILHNYIAAQGYGVQVSDTTTDATTTEAGYKKIYTT